MRLNDLTPQEAARELLRRRQARTSLRAFALAIDIPGAPANDDDELDWTVAAPENLPLAAHHLLILDAVQECFEAHMGRLMLFFPPGSAKSTYAGVVAPPWAMGRWPGFKVISTSYAAKPAFRSSKRARAICAQPAYAAIWPELADGGRVTVASGSAAVDEWSLTNDSTLLAAGIMGGITSARADALLIDDPVANREQADSPAIQAKTLAGYEDDLRSRLKPGGSICLIQTRWNPNDLAGLILPADWNGESGWIPCRDGRTWRVICVPAIAEREDDPLGRPIGERLWPEWFDAEHFQQFMGQGRTWSSLFQQRPRPDTGNQFELAWFRWYDPDARPGAEADELAEGAECARPQQLTRYGASDYATTAKDLESQNEPDFTEHGIFGLDVAKRVFVLDWWFKQTELDESVTAQLALLRKHAPIDRWIGEKGTQENAVRPVRRLLSRESDTFAGYHYLPTQGDKVSKLQSFRAMVKAGRVFLPVNRPWATRLVDLLVGFPKVRFDDGPDVCGLFGRAIDDALSPEPPQGVKPEPKPFTRAWLDARDRARAAEEADRKRYYR